MKTMWSDGTVTLYIERDSEPSLDEAQSAVGGYVELVELPDGDQLLVDEEGLLKNKRVNSMATRIARRLIVGDALILTGKARWK